MVRGDGIHLPLGVGLCPTAWGLIPWSGTASHCQRYGLASFPGARGAELCPGALPSAPARCRTTPHSAAGAGEGYPDPRPAVTVLHQRRLAGRPQPLQPARHRHGGRAVAAATRKLPPAGRKRFRPGRAERGPARPGPGPALLRGPSPLGCPTSAPSGTAASLGGRSCPRGCGCCQPPVGGLETLAA